MEKNSLLDLNIGEIAEISAISSGKQASKRLVDLGLTPGTEIKVIRKAPGGGPIQIEARNSKLIIGRGLASKVIVQKSK